MKFRIEQLRDVKDAIRELALGLRKLTFGDNFSSFEEEVVISAGSELGIRNHLTKIPKKFIIVDQTGHGVIARGITEWSKELVYLINYGPEDVVATVVFLEE